MQLAEGIRRLGFRKWYERQLLQSHGHLALTFVCTIGLFAAAEAFSRFASWNDRVSDIFTLLVCAAAGLWALRRYLYLLNHAEYVANQADCPQCKTYGRFELAEERPADHSTRVRCRKCGHCWTIHS